MIANFDLITVGNATVDAFLAVSKKNKHFRLDAKTNELCVKSGDKAVIDNIHFSIGGNAANVAVGLSRIGLKTAIVAEIGTDEFAAKIIAGLKKEGVSELLLKQTANTTSPFSIIITYKKERTIFCEDVKREHDFNFEDITAKWIYLTSLGEKWEEPYRRTLLFAKTVGAKIAFNPGTLQVDKGKNSLLKILKETEILFVNKEEAKALLKTSEKSIQNLTKKLIKLGVKTVVITDGKNGSFLYNESTGFLKQGIVRGKVLGKAGAGDAYSTGFLGAILSGKSLKEAMKWGTINSGSVVSKIGTQTGLLKRKEIEERC